MTLHDRSIRRARKHQTVVRLCTRVSVGVLWSMLQFAVCLSIIVSLAGLTSQAYGLTETNEEAPAEEATEPLESFAAVPARQRSARRLPDILVALLPLSKFDFPGNACANAAIARGSSSARSKRGHMLPTGGNAPLLI